MGSFTSLVISEDTDEMPQGLHSLLRQTRSLENKTQSTFEIITCDPSICRMDHPCTTISNFMGNSFGLKQVK